jgi:TonB-dependent receptor
MALSFICISTALFSQGTIRGKVSDVSNSQGLPGARVLVKGTTSGTATDLLGDYQLTASTGTVEVEVSYLGFTTMTKSIQVNDKETVTLDFALESDVSYLKGVEIVGNLQGQAKALNQQRTADNIKNVVAADQIGRFPDPNAAEALQRVPGVNIERDQGEGRYVLVRGLSPSFTNMNVNGEQIPSPEADVRFVALDAIPSDQLASMEISKSLTPEMDGDAIGGSVNLITRTAQTAEPAISGSLLGGYNRLMNAPNIQGSVSYGQRFSNQRLGIMLNATYYSNNLGSDNWERDQDGTPEPDDDIFELRDYELTRTRSGLSGTVDYKFNPNHELYFRGLYTRFTDREWRRKYEFAPADEEVVRAVKDRFEEQVISSYNFGGKHIFPRFTLDYEGSMSQAFQDTPYDNEVSFVAGLPSSVEFNPEFPILSAPGYLANDQYEFDQIEMGSTRADDQNLSARFNVTVPYRLGEHTGALKFGGKQRIKEKKYTITANTFESFGGVPNLDFFEGGLLDLEFLDGQYDLSVNADVGQVIEHFNENTGEYELQVEDKSIDEALEAYEAREEITAAYLMVRHQWKKLLIVGGVRYEGTRVSYDSKEAEISPAGDLIAIRPISGESNYDYVLPQLQFRYEVNPLTNLRASAAYSYARPNFSQIIPAQEANLEDRELTLGNASLVPVSAFNLDLLAEKYYGNVGVLSGGFFYKKLDDFIYNRTLFAQPYLYNPDVLVNVTQAQNGNEASLVGAELAFQRNLGLISEFMQSFSIYLNYTFTYSTADIQSRGADESNPDARENITLPGQSAHVGNASLAFERKRFSSRVALNFNGQYLQEIGGTEEFDLYTKRRMQMDLSVGYVISKQFRVFAEVMNATNQPFETFQGDEDTVVQREFYSWWSRVGLKFDF